MREHKIVTKQEALDRFVNDRLIGNVPLARETKTSGGYDLPMGRCVYSKAVNGGCAIGCLIPDELYKPEMDDTGSFGVYDLFAAFPEVAEVFEDPQSPFWPQLQQAHDARSEAIWQGAFKQAVELLLERKGVD